MASAKMPTPIMTPDEERYMAFEGLVQWTAAVVTQSARVTEAQNRQFPSGLILAREQRCTAILAFHTECHFFAVAAKKLLEFRGWATDAGLCSTIDFREIDSFPVRDIYDLRDMREHIVEYFRGTGRKPARWVVTTGEYDADASAVAGTVIGGRLDWVKFGAAAERLLHQLLVEPIPYPPQ